MPSHGYLYRRLWKISEQWVTYLCTLRRPSTFRDRPFTSFNLVCLNQFLFFFFSHPVPLILFITTSNYTYRTSRCVHFQFSLRAEYTSSSRAFLFLFSVYSSLWFTGILISFALARLITKTTMTINWNEKADAKVRLYLHLSLMKRHLLSIPDILGDCVGP